MLSTGVSYRRLGIPALEELKRRGRLLRCIGLRGTDAGGPRGLGSRGWQLGRTERRAPLPLLEDRTRRGAGPVARGQHVVLPAADQIAATPNIEVHQNTEVLDGGGPGRLEQLKVERCASLGPTSLCSLSCSLRSPAASPGLLGASAPYRIFFWAHAIGAYGILLLLSAKAVVVLDAVRRRSGVSADRVSAFLLAFLLVCVLTTGLLWVTAGRRTLLGFSVINVHAWLAIGLVALLSWHALARRWIVRVPAATDRRAFLRLAGLLAAGFVVWQAERVTARLLDLPGSRRRFTGSYEVGSFSSAFPATSWLDDDPEPVDQSAWRLVVDGEVERPRSLSHADLQELAREPVAATIDCTGGWYSRQRWDGVPLAHVLELVGPKESARSVSIESVTGYGRRFSLDHARKLTLATHVAGQELTHGHGFPVRLVVPDRRGFDWVKWVTRVEVTDSSRLLQPPLPLT